MPVQNSDISRIFNELADLLEIRGENHFRVQAYRTAARNIDGLGENIREMVEAGADITEIPGIGKDLAKKIEEILAKGTLSKLEEIKGEVPETLLGLMKIEGLGPKRIGILFSQMGIKNIAELEKAAKAGKIRELEGFGEKTELNILQEIERGAGNWDKKERVIRAEAEEIAAPLIEYLKMSDGVDKIEIAGSFRRGCETIGDLDILVSEFKESDVMQRFVEYQDVKRVLAHGATKSSVVMKSDLQVDLRVVPDSSFGAALHYFTGSKEHNIEIRKMGMERGLKINEYGVFENERHIAGRTEKEVFEQVGLPYIEPELRENRGELEAAAKGKLPELIEIKDIRGDLHTHTSDSDGRSDLAEMALAAMNKGYDYLAVSDHSKRVTIANGLDENRLSEQIDRIDRLNEKMGRIVLLKSIEVDILEDGSLDLPDRILERLDLVICAVHHKFRLPIETQTERIIRGINNPYAIILAHPTGRLINQREPYELDMDRLIKAAGDSGCALELNAQPGRMDLSDLHCRMAVENDVMIAISTDAHSIYELDLMNYGIKQARRGWVRPEDVLNTKSPEELFKWIRDRNVKK